MTKPFYCGKFDDLGRLERPILMKFQNRSLTTRRSFIKRTTILAGGAAGTRWLGAPAILSAASPNSQLGIAVIACGGMGEGNPGVAAKERLVALVDVDDKPLAKAIKNV